MGMDYDPITEEPMRPKSVPSLNFEWRQEDSDLHHKIVRENRAKYKAFSRILDANPAILGLAHRDLESLSAGGPEGRSALHSSETLLRALVVMRVEGDAYRGAALRIAEQPFLQGFLRLGNRTPPDYSTIARAFKAVRPGTWKAINLALARAAADSGAIRPEEVRADTTVVESAIRWPTDASLLWDSHRLLARLLRRGRAMAPHLCPHRFHDRKAYVAHLAVTREMGRKSKKAKRRAKKLFRALIAKVERVAGIAAAFCAAALGGGCAGLLAVAAEVAAALRTVRKVLSAAKRAQVKGEKVPAAERVFSVFEAHVELIMRGKAGKPAEFGHAVLLVQTREKFVTHYDAMEKKVPDARLGAACVEAHEEAFGGPPDGFTGDAGFNPGDEERARLEERVEAFAVPKRLSHWAETIGEMWRRFRAGVEGSISVLKRSFGLAKCRFKGFKSFAASVGLGVFCHNLTVLARMQA